QLELASPINGAFGTQLAAVTFNGIAAPIIYTSATRVSAIVPYAISGTTANVTVTYQGQVVGVQPTVEMGVDGLWNTLYDWLSLSLILPRRRNLWVSVGFEQRQKVPRRSRRRFQLAVCSAFVFWSFPSQFSFKTSLPEPANCRVPDNTAVGH